MSSILWQSFGVFGAGVLTSFTPCVYPMIPITVGYLGQGNQNAAAARERLLPKIKILGFFSGQVLTFTALGVFAVFFGELLGFTAQIPIVQFSAGGIFFLLGYFSLKGELPKFITKWNNKTSSSRPLEWQNRPLLLFGQAASVGAATSLVASPCTGPVLAGVLALISQVGSVYTGSFLMFLYALGLSSIFLILGLGLVRASQIPKSGKWMVVVHKFSSILLLGAGCYFIYLGWVLL